MVLPAIAGVNVLAILTSCALKLEDSEWLETILLLREMGKQRLLDERVCLGGETFLDDLMMLKFELCSLCRVELILGSLSLVSMWKELDFCL